MSYRVEITKRAEKQLQKLPTQAQEKIAEGIGLLSYNPSNSALDVKQLKNDPQAKYRLRVGSYRVKFNRDDLLKIIEIVRIGHRREIYK